MEKLSIDFENCYGIGSLKNEFDFSKSNVVIVYAPNGTMKTSFARVFQDISRNDKIKPCDRVYPDRKSVFSVLVDGKEINYEAVLVVNAEDHIDSVDKISNFIANADLKKRHDSIYADLDKNKNDFIKKLKKVSQSTDCESEFISTFEDGKGSFYTALLSIVDKLRDKCQKYDFRYNDVFDKKENVRKFLVKHRDLLRQYFDNYFSILSNSKLFKKSDNSFGTTQASDILKAIEDNAFFDAGHRFVLGGDTNISSAKKLQELIDEEINNIVNDVSLKEIFNKIDKATGASLEMKAFKKVIERNNLLLTELQDYDGLKKKVWLGYLFELKNDAILLVQLFNDNKDELEKILDEAKKELRIWKKIIADFNLRFYVPYTVKLANHQDIILKKETANLEFEYKDADDVSPILQSKDDLLKILSKGELRAYYILQLLFDIEARKARGGTNLVIFDDIADSFDYKNKYAIIEYLKDIRDSGNFKIIILTHNFDFYRTISSRLDLKDSVFMVIKGEDRAIKIEEGQYRRDVFLSLRQNSHEPKKFISLIPFVRNICNYLEKNSDDYVLLTKCLHLKTDSQNILAKDVLKIFNSRIKGLSDTEINFGGEKIVDLIFRISKDIAAASGTDEISLENKIVLSIAIRLKSEQFMIKKLPHINLYGINYNQTRLLYDEYKKRYSTADDASNVMVLDRANLMTPENIHVNAFMYEPLIDMSVRHLIDLYNDVSDLSSSG